MLQRATLIVLVIMALALWAGLALFMNHRPPDLVNQAIFLVIWGSAIACTVIPLAYAANAWSRGFMGRRWVLGEAARQGLMAAVLAVILMALRFVGALNLLVGGLLTLVVVMVETLIHLRNR